MWAITPTATQAEDEYFGYDAMGHLKHWGSASPSEVGVSAHYVDASYDLAGNVLTTTYPDGLTVTNGYDAAGRLNSVASGSASYLAAASYSPDGSPKALTYGNGVVESITRNSRLQICEDQVTLGNTSYLDRRYFYGTNNSSGQQCNAVGGNNGNIWNIVDGLGGSYSQTFNYDTLNRIQAWTAPNMAGAYRQQFFQSDAFGNLNQSGTSSFAGLPAYTANNQLPPSAINCLGVYGNPPGYDAAGNVTCTGTQNQDARAYVWDTEERLIQAWGERNNNTYYPLAVYSYDAAGKRIRSDQFASGTYNVQSWREYSYFNGQVLAEKDNTGGWTDYIYANGKKIAQRTPSYPVLHAHASLSQPSCATRFVQSGLGGWTYAVQSGDRLQFDLNTSNGSAGLMLIPFSGSVDYYVAPGTGGITQKVSLALASSVGKTIDGFWPVIQGNGSSGSADAYLSHMSIVRQDGGVVPIFNGPGYRGRRSAVRLRRLFGLAVGGAGDERPGQRNYVFCEGPGRNGGNGVLGDRDPCLEG